MGWVWWWLLLYDNGSRSVGQLFTHESSLLLLHYHLLDITPCQRVLTLEVVLLVLLLAVDQEREALRLAGILRAS